MKAITRFNRWFSSSGYRIYPSREAAAKVWISRGIEGLDDAPPWTTPEQVVRAATFFE